MGCKDYPGTGAWVCFECRLAVRRPVMYAGNVPCPECGGDCTPLGTQVPVPPKAKVREWKALQRQAAKWRRDGELYRYESEIRRRHRPGGR